MELIEFLDKGITMYHAVDTVKEILLKNNYERLYIENIWNLKNGGKYFIIVNDSTVIAFNIGENRKRAFRIIGSHTDSPGFKLKSNPVIKSNGFLKLNTEVYGGPILNTWFDRPLSIAGRVFLKGKETYSPIVKLINFDKNLLTIPNLAIHMSRDEGSNGINPQIHTLPVLSSCVDNFNIENLISKEFGINENEILSYDLFLYSREKAGISGLNDEFINSGKIDNLGMVHASLSAFLKARESDYIQIFAAFDNEEIGSATMQGADSAMFKDVLKKISLSLNFTEQEFISSLYNSFMISADQAHSVHPNYSEKADPTNQPVINKGPVIKESARKSYATDAYGKAILIDIFQKNNIPYQIYFNRSDVRGGSTIGAIIETTTGIRNIDIGNPLFSMHSICEMGGVKDQQYMIDFMQAFYEA